MVLHAERGNRTNNTPIVQRLPKPMSRYMECSFDDVDQGTCTQALPGVGLNDDEANIRVSFGVIYDLR